MNLIIAFNTMVCTAVLLTPAFPAKFGESQLMYEWTSLDFDWPSEEVKQESIRNGSFVPERNLLTGIKVYKGTVYLTIPRWKWNSGQPATLVKVVQVGSQAKLRPYPSWEAQRLGDCKVLQYVQSMEIDPNTGLMYVIDVGRTGIAGGPSPQNRCPAKLLVYNLTTDSVVDRYEFPDSVVSRTRNFMNDIVLDYVNGAVGFAYITDVSEEKLYIVDFQTRSSYAIEDDSMKPEQGNGTIISVNGVDYTFNAGVDGIAISSDFDYLYYCPVGGYHLYQVPTEKLRNLTTSSSSIQPGDIRAVGRKVSQSDGMAFGGKRLFYGALSLNALYMWDIPKDEKDQGKDAGAVAMTTQILVAEQNQTMQWIDTFAFDDRGWLWFVSNKLFLFTNGKMDFSGASGSNMRVGRVFVNESSYLYGADQRTLMKSSRQTGGNGAPVSGGAINLLLLGFVYWLFSCVRI